MHYDSEAKKMVDAPLARPKALVSNYRHLRSAGDNTVAAGSGEAPYVAGVSGGYFVHGSAPVHQKLEKELSALPVNSGEKKPLIPHFSTAKYEHATALADPLAYFSTLHAIIKIVTTVVDKECG